MCTGGSAPKPKPRPVIQPEPVQPPSVAESVADVKIGSEEGGTSRRKKVTRSSLRQNASTGSASPGSGLGS
jgi:hypothetical protein